MSQVITSHLFTWSNITIPKTDAATDATIFITPNLDICSSFSFPLPLPAFVRWRLVPSPPRAVSLSVLNEDVDVQVSWERPDMAHGEIKVI